MSVKKCSSCNEVKPIDDFNKRLDGYQPKCKKCSAEYARKYRQDHLEEYRAKDRARSGRSKTREARDQQKIYSRAWRSRQTDFAERRKAFPSYSIVYSRPSEEAIRAHTAILLALRHGELVRPPNCQRCGKEAFVEAAHKDYSKPFDIEWLCRHCHRAEDAAEPKGGNIKNTIQGDT